MQRTIVMIKNDNDDDDKDGKQALGSVWRTLFSVPCAETIETCLVA